LIPSLSNGILCPTPRRRNAGIESTPQRITICFQGMNDESTF
jgi:hypothetical protein